MELKKSYRKPLILIGVDVIWNQRTGRLLVVLLYTLIIFASGYYLHWSGFSFSQTYSSLKRDIDHWPRRIRAMLSRPAIEHIAIDIKQEDFMRLAYQREIALSRGILISGEDDFVPATITHNGETVKVRIRLKGDSTDHLEGDKWSYRIDVKGDHTLFGMEQFSIQHPRTRNYVYEWIFHQALRREGLVSLRYDFINVTLNGKDLGVYALEEHFDKRLIENNEFIEGPIVRFNEDPRWLEEFNNPSRDYIIYNSFLPTDIDTYQTGNALLDPKRYAQHTRAIHLLEAFRRGELNTSDVFDLQKLARLFAIADLTGAQHSINWANMRFYYNPITSKLEPIGFDGDSGKQIRGLSVQLSPLVDPIYLERLFSDPAFFEEYISTLERVAQPSYLDAFFAGVDDDLKRNLNVLYSEFPDSQWPTIFYKDIYYRNQKFIRSVLNPTKAINAYFHGASDNYLELELGNIQTMPIEILSVSYQDFPPFQPIARTILPERPISYIEPLVDCRLRSTETVDYQVVKFKLPEGMIASETLVSDLKINYRLLGTGQIREEIVFPWSYLENDFVENDFFLQEPNVQTFGFLKMDESAGRILISPGTWSLDRSLIIPPGYQVIAREGTQLNLSNSATILSYSPLEFIGSEDNPIIIDSADSTGQGIVVMNADQPSILKYVVMRNLSNPAQSGWELTGAVTFYQSPVAVSHSQFLESRSEDALNIVRTEFSIENSFFSGAFSDSFDSDFTKGRISESNFFNSGNDAIDASGSVIEIQNVSVDGTGDKGLSIGERSQVSASGIEIKNAFIAVASKDLSQLTLQDITISDSVFGITAYEKKSEFGPASIQVHDLEMMAVNTPYLIESQSSVAVNDQVMDARQENVYQTLYEGEITP
jgi:hypothetical protein